MILLLRLREGRIRVVALIGYASGMACFGRLASFAPRWGSRREFVNYPGY